MATVSRITLTCLAVLALLLNACDGFTPAPIPAATDMQQRGTTEPLLAHEEHCDEMMSASLDDKKGSMSRRNLFQSTAAVALSSAATAFWGAPVPAAQAAERRPLEDLLYTIVRVREATQQETRLIRSGKFKDVQRANVKLAVKFMIENYKLNDAFLAASNYLENNKRMAAVNVGQSAVQDLYTILEYFDASDVQNLKIGSATLSYDKQDVVLKGLDATKKSIDDFLAYFPQDTVDQVKAKVKEENDMNFKEFDRNLGDIVNPNPV